MPREIFPSSYECDCGYVAHFSENGIRELKAMSMKKQVILSDSEEPRTQDCVLQGRNGRYYLPLSQG